MSKKVNTTTIASEIGKTGAAIRLVGGSAASSSSSRPVSQPVDQSTNNASKPVDQEASQPAIKETAQSFDQSPILGRPKSFYITKRQDKDIDTLVRKVTSRTEHLPYKVDRSTVLRLILESSDITADEYADHITNQLTNKLVSQLTK